MSGSIDYTALYAASAGGTNHAITALAVSLAGGGGAGGAGSVNPLTALQAAEDNETQDVAAVARQPQIQRTLAAFTAAVGSATSVLAALQNPDVLNVLLTANGLGDQTAYTALAQKALTSNLSDPNALANQLPDARWKTVAGLYNFATTGLATLQNPQVLATLTNGYAEVTWRNSLDAATPGLSNALDFRSRAGTITSADQILGDPTFRAVVTTALGIPPQIAYQNLGAQERAVSAQVDISRFKDPHFVDSFTQQYLIQAQSQSSGAASSSSIDALAVQAQGLVV